MKIVLVILIFLSCEGACSAQTTKLCIRGGTFSPYSLYNALLNKNPRPDLHRFTTSSPHSLGIGINVEDKGGIVYGFNATVRRIDINQTFSNTSFTANQSFTTWENYDFDFNVGKSIYRTNKSQMKILGGLGIQKRREYFMYEIRYSPNPKDSTLRSSKMQDEIRPISSLPIFFNFKFELDYKISKRFDIFFCYESNVFIKRNYSIRHTIEKNINGLIVTELYEGAKFSNNSISTTFGFKYTLNRIRMI